MNKIIIAFDGTNFPTAAFEFCRRLNEQRCILLTGIFIPQATLANMWSYASSTAELFVPLVEDNEAELVQENIRKFEKLCKDNKIDYRIHKDFFDLGLTALEKESLFADLMVISSQEFYKGSGSAEASMLTENLLHDARCPVLLLPEGTNYPESTIVAYDGSDDCVFALKQFIYLFPHLLGLPATFVFVAKNTDDAIPAKKELKELANAHFRKTELLTFSEKEGEHFENWCSRHPEAIVVSGSFGRSGMSLFFKKSFIEKIMTATQRPLFIAHR
jgi:nucleotide-binding universal stress UspA family protein